MNLENRCPYIGKIYNCKGVETDILSGKSSNFGNAFILLYEDYVSFMTDDVNKCFYKDWRYIKKMNNSYVYEDEDLSQWIIGESLISYTEVRTGKHFTFMPIDIIDSNQE